MSDVFVQRHIADSVTYSTFKDVFIHVTFLTFLTFSTFFLGRFHLCMKLRLLSQNCSVPVFSS